MYQRLYPCKKMKRILAALVFGFVALSVNAQGIDTVKTNNKSADQYLYKANKLYYEKNYDSLGHLVFEGLRFNKCFLGTIKYYWSEGQLKEIRRFLVDTPVAADIKRWPWLKNYRVWDANRKVFHYPENWIEADLPDDKSPYFRELEKQLRCNVPDGVWEVYEKKGKRVSSIRFERGLRLR